MNIKLFSNINLVEGVGLVTRIYNSKEQNRLIYEIKFDSGVVRHYNRSEIMKHKISRRKKYNPSEVIQELESEKQALIKLLNDQSTTYEKYIETRDRIDLINHKLDSFAINLTKHNIFDE